MTKIKNIAELKILIGLDTRELYVRWSRGFVQDKKLKHSTDYQSGKVHAGLSAVRINPDWASDDQWLARRITEYSFLRVKDHRISCHIYSAKKIGIDSDGYDSITNIEHVASVSDKVISELRDLLK